MDRITKPGFDFSSEFVLQALKRLTAYEDTGIMPGDVARLKANYEQQGAMYFEACEDRRTMGDEIGRLTLLLLRICWRQVKQEERTHKARRQRDNARAEVERQAEMIDHLQATIDRLAGERDGWQRRAEAAEQDLRAYPQCDTCKHYRQIGRGHWTFDGPDCEDCMDDDDRPAWVWHSPQLSAAPEAQA